MQIQCVYIIQGRKTERKQSLDLFPQRKDVEGSEVPPEKGASTPGPVAGSAECGWVAMGRDMQISSPWLPKIQSELQWKGGERMK